MNQHPSLTVVLIGPSVVGGLEQVHVQVLGDNVQYVVPADGAGNYANGLNVGPISFQ